MQCKWNVEIRHCGKIPTNQQLLQMPAVQQVKVQEKNVENKVETNSAETQTGNQKNASVEPTKDAPAENK